MHAEISLAAPRWGHIGENGWSDGMGIWGPLLMIIWLVLAVVVTCLLVRSVNNRAAAAAESTGAERARDILAERFAKGEISTEEYSERLTRLS
jgi:putative membrane protein